MASSAGAVLFGLVVAALVGLVLLGGIRSIASVTSRLVPAMAGHVHRWPAWSSS